MFIRKLNVFLLLAVLCLLPFALNECGSDSLPEADRYYNKENGFSIKFPKGWRIETAQEERVFAVRALSPPEGVGDSFRESIKLTTEDMPVKQRLDDFASDILMNSLNDIPGYKVLEGGETVIDNTRAKWTISTYPMEEVEVKVLAYNFIKGQRGFVIVCDTESEKFPAFREIFEKAALSFKFE